MYYFNNKSTENKLYNCKIAYVRPIYEHPKNEELKLKTPYLFCNPLLLFLCKKNYIKYFIACEVISFYRKLITHNSLSFYIKNPSNRVSLIIVFSY